MMTMVRVSASSRLALPMMMIAMLQLLLLQSPTAVAVKPGSCPTLPPDAVGTCDEACTDDESCPGEQKCCSNGCGHGCVEAQVLGPSDVEPLVLKPIQVELGEASLSNGTLLGSFSASLPALASRSVLAVLYTGVVSAIRRQGFPGGKPKAGECLFVDTRLIRCAFQPGECSEDCQCPREQKCCNTGCTMACTKPAIVKPGSCPAMPVGFKPTCDIHCLNDDSCSEDQKCCSNGCGRLCLRPASGIVSVKPGSCPTPPPDAVGTCDEACADDESCPGEQKCCSNGCGHGCVEPEDLILKDTELVPAKPGSCPTLPPDTMGTCDEACTDDDSCPGEQKCCSNGCGHSCVQPIQVEPGRVKPEVRPGCCREPDSFPIQYCIWKNDRCRGDGECPGVQKCCPHSCGNRCEDVKPGKPKPGECPFVYTSLIRCAFSPPRCSEDWQCPGEQKCCNTGCTMACSKPVKNKNGFCPYVDTFRRIKCVVRSDLNQCQQDWQCPDNEKCCNTGCELICIKPVKAGSCPVWNFSAIICIRYNDGCSSDDDCPGKKKCCSVPCGVGCLDPDLVIGQIGKEVESDAKEE